MTHIFIRFPSRLFQRKIDPFYCIINLLVVGTNFFTINQFNFVISITIVLLWFLRITLNLVNEVPNYRILFVQSTRRTTSFSFLISINILIAFWRLLFRILHKIRNRLWIFFIFRKFWRFFLIHLFRLHIKRFVFFWQFLFNDFFLYRFTYFWEVAFENGSNRYFSIPTPNVGSNNLEPWGVKTIVKIACWMSAKLVISEISPSCVSPGWYGKSE